MEINRNTVLITILVLIALWLILPMIWTSPESFDSSTSVFVPEGCPRWGLRGEPLRRSCISKYFIRPDRHIMLNNSGGQMWVSNKSPGQEGMSDCRNVKCPPYNGYDQEDHCWKCGNYEGPSIPTPNTCPNC